MFPMAAIYQAQCCELERLKLVDGTVTDDSDAFAFGGKVVYKNIFSDRKFVEAYVLPDLEKVCVCFSCASVFLCFCGEKRL